MTSDLAYSSTGTLPPALIQKIKYLQQKSLTFTYTKKEHVKRNPLGSQQMQQLLQVIEVGEMILPYILRAHEQMLSDEYLQQKIALRNLEKQEDMLSHKALTIFDLQQHGQWKSQIYFPALEQDAILTSAMWRHALMSVMTQLRPFGLPENYHPIVHIEGDESLLRLSQRAFRYIPQDWLRTFGKKHVILRSPMRFTGSYTDASGLYCAPGDPIGHPRISVIQIKESYLHSKENPTAAVGIIYHEWLHHVEATYPLVYRLSLAYRQYRKWLYPYDNGNFLIDHMATNYEDDQNTEIISAGLGAWLFGDNIDNAGHMLYDEQTICFLLGMLAFI